MKNNEVIIVDLLGNMEDKYHLIPNYSEKEASRLFNWIFLQEDPMCFVETNGKIESFKVLIELKKHNKLTKLQQKKVLSHIISGMDNKEDSRRKCFYSTVGCFLFDTEEEDLFEFCFPLLSEALLKDKENIDVESCIFKILCQLRLNKKFFINYFDVNTYKHNYDLYVQIKSQLFKRWKGNNSFMTFHDSYFFDFEKKLKKLTTDEILFISENFGHEGHQEIIDIVLLSK